MSSFNNDLGSAVERFFWTVTYQKRKFLVPVLLLIVLVLSFYLYQRYTVMELRVKHLSQNQAITLLAAAKDLKVGDTLSLQKLKATPFLKREKDKLVTDVQANSKNEYKQVVFELHDRFDQLVNLPQILQDRVLQVPVKAGAILREEYLAPVGTMPGIEIILENGYTLFDVKVPKTGFNVYIKPGDEVDLYRSTKVGTSLLASKLKVLLVDSKAIGESPAVVEENSRESRNLTLALPEPLFRVSSQLSRDKRLIVTYHKGSIANHHQQKTSTKKKPLFQALTFISGDKKEVVHE